MDFACGHILVDDVAVLEVDDSFFYVNRAETDLSLVKQLRGYRVQRWDPALTLLGGVVTVVLAPLVYGF